MKNQKGVTALSMMILIIIIILLASFAVFSSRDLVVEGNIATIYNEIDIIRDSILGLSINESYEDGIFSSTKIDDINDYNARVGGNLKSGRTYYYLAYADDTMSDVYIQSLNEFLDVRSVQNSYIVSIIDVGEVEVFLVDGIRIEDTYYYSYEEISQNYSKASE